MPRAWGFPNGRKKVRDNKGLSPGGSRPMFPGRSKQIAQSLSKKEALQGGKSVNENAESGVSYL